MQLRGILKTQFRENAHVTDPAKLHALKSSCVPRALEPARQRRQF